MCPDHGLNLRPFGVWDNTPTSQGSRPIFKWQLPLANTGKTRKFTAHGVLIYNSDCQSYGLLGNKNEMEVLASNLLNYLL